MKTIWKVIIVIVSALSFIAGAVYAICNFVDIRRRFKFHPVKD